MPFHPKLALFILLTVLLAACGAPATGDATATISEDLIQTAMAELRDQGTQAVALTPSATPEQETAATPQPQAETTEQPEATPEPDQSGGQDLLADHGDGVYLVGVDISTGQWQSQEGQGDSCYWVRRKYSGIIFGSYYGPSGVSMRISPEDYEVEMTGCGTWTYVGP